MEERKQEDGLKKEEHQKTDPEGTENITSQNQGGAETDDQQPVHLISDEELKTALDDLKTKPTFCLVHKETEVSLFCRSCDRLVCTSCFIDGNHGNHKFCKIDDVVTTKKQELDDRIKEAKEDMTESLQQNIKIIKKQQENVLKNCKIVSAEIDERKADMLQEVETWGINMQSLVREHQKNRLHRLNGIQAESGTCLANLEIFRRDPNYGDIIDGIKLIHALELLQNNTGAQAKDESEASEGENELIFTKGEGNTEKMDIWLGHITGIIPVDNLGKKSKKFKFCDSKVDYISPLDERRAFVVTEEQLYFVDLTKAKYRQEDLVPLMKEVVYITPVTKQGIYVQQKDSTVVKRVTESGQIYHFADLKPEASKESWQSIRISNTGMVISITETKLTKFGNYGNTEKNVIVKMMQYNKHGIKGKEMLSHTFKADHFLYNNQFPESVQTASDVYIQTTTKDIPENSHEPGAIMNMKSTTPYKGCIGSQPELTFHPKGLCKDQNDHLIVSDYWNHAVHQLTPEGEFQKFLMREENGLIHPTAVGIDGLNWMWVTQRDGNIHVVKYIP